MPEIKLDIRTATLVVAASDSLHKNMADYVCVGTDDHTEINAALAAAAGGKVVLLEGNYSVAGNLVVPASTHLTGMGKGTIITTTAAIAITNAVVINGNNVTISDMKIVLGAGAGDAGSRPNVIYATSKALIWLENLWLVGDTTVADDGSNARQNGICFDNCNECKIVDCRTEGNDRHGIFVISADNNMIRGNSCKGNTQNGIFLDSSANNVLTGNNCQENTQYGILLSGANNNTITGNTCQGNSESGICLNYADYNTITGNTCQGNAKHGIFLDSSADYNTITGNTCAGNNESGATYSGIYVESSYVNTITGNQCDANGLHGIYISHSDYSTVTGNVCANSNTGDGINVLGDGGGNSDYNTLTGNVCYDNADDGIAIEGGGDANKNIVLGNQLLGNSGTPLVDNGLNTEIGHNITA